MEDMKMVLEYVAPDGKLETLRYRKTLPYGDKCVACEFIADSVIGADGIYQPYKLGLAQKYVLMGYFTDVADGFESGEHDAMMDKMFDIIDHTDVYERLMKKISMDCWTEIVTYADKMIEYRKTIRPVDRTAQKLDKLLEALTEKILDLDADEILDNLVDSLGTLGAAGDQPVMEDAEQ